MEIRGGAGAERTCESRSEVRWMRGGADAVEIGGGAVRWEPQECSRPDRRREADAVGDGDRRSETRSEGRRRSGRRESRPEEAEALGAWEEDESSEVGKAREQRRDLGLRAR